MFRSDHCVGRIKRFSSKSLYSGVELVIIVFDIFLPSWDAFHSAGLLRAGENAWLRRRASRAGMPIR